MHDGVAATEGSVESSKGVSVVLPARRHVFVTVAGFIFVMPAPVAGIHVVSS